MTSVGFYVRVRNKFGTWMCLCEFILVCTRMYHWSCMYWGTVPFLMSVQSAGRALSRQLCSGISKGRSLMDISRIFSSARNVNHCSHRQFTLPASISCTQEILEVYHSPTAPPCQLSLFADLSSSPSVLCGRKVWVKQIRKRDPLCIKGEGN